MSVASEIAVRAEPPLTVIEPRGRWSTFDFHELWRFRELLLFLIWRDVKIRYKQTAIGASWALLQPLAAMAAFTIALGRVVGEPGAAVPYWLFVLCGLVPWTFFSSAVSQTGVSVVNNQALVTKVYFPRILLPLSAAGLAGVDFLVGFGVLIVAALGVGVVPGVSLLALPLVLAVMALAAVGLGVFLAALTVRFRDFRVVVPLAVQLWLFLTPAIYDQSGRTVGPENAPLFLMNPMQAVVANFRAALFGMPLDWLGLGVAAAIGIVLFIAGGWYFRRTERAFADII
ncbi:MAG TPA: ABC transporter permease [Gemmataceae bacterium]|jgi:lipopolysaccharide transport system permease protein